MIMKTSSYIEGVMHPAKDGGSRLERARALVMGDKLLLVPEPNNPVDRNAILIYKADDPEHDIGYMAASSARRICRMIECGATFHSEVHWIDRGRNDWFRVHYSIEQLTLMTTNRRPVRRHAPKYRSDRLGPIEPLPLAPQYISLIEPLPHLSFIQKAFNVLSALFK